jgi:sensor c-di-GMP phosphodiesterase-like protein
MHLSATVKDAAKEPLSPAANQSTVDKVLALTANGTARLGDKLYMTRCSSLNTNCVTAFTSVSEAAHGETRLVAGSTAAGGVLGVLLGMAVTFFFRRNKDLSQQLRRAIYRDKLQLVYQPIVVLSTRQIVGAEALARWTDEDGNSVEPDVFVKLAEENGFVGALTRSVVHRSLHDLAKTLQSRPGFRLSINVSGADLVDPEFLPMLAESLKEAKVKPESVVIEISEKSTSQSEMAMETIRILRRMGHSIHIDDFGTGYSNLDKLLYLFADTIKIDKAFTGVIGTESVAVAILPQILAMAKSLNLEVVVEGVETDRQANYFPTERTQIYGQGWLYGRPVSIEAFQGLLAANLAIALAATAYLAKPPVFATPESEESDSDWTTKPGKLQIMGSRVA